MIILLKKLFLVLIFTLFLFNYSYANSVESSEDLKSLIKSSIINYETELNIEYSSSRKNLKNTIKSAIESVQSENEYVYFVLKSYSYNYSYIKKNPITFITIKFSYYETKSESDYVDTKSKEILRTIIKDNMDDFEKEKVIHDWIVNNVTYDTSKKIHSAYSALNSPNKTVCQGYALLTYRMMNNAGIQTIMVPGKGSGVSHLWNMVNINNNWYHLDVTWDDPINNQNKLYYNYFNLTNKEIKKKKHSYNESKYPKATTPYIQNFTTFIDEIIFNSKL